MEKKNDIKSLLSRKKPSAEEIDKITEQIHAPTKVATQPMVTDTKPITRISVNAPTWLYLKCKTKATMQGVPLMTYIMALMEKDTENM